jgi:hypothetical protein
MLLRRLPAMALSLLMACPPLYCAEEGGERWRILRNAEPILDIRSRLENVNQDGSARRAAALTLRTRLGFESGKILQTTLLAEAELVAPLTSSYHDSPRGPSRYPVVADPESYDLNRLQLTNTALARTTIVAGRQRIVLDDQRFIANVGWRQNEQTFDALRVTHKPNDRLVLDAGWLSQVNRVFGRNSPAGQYHGDSYTFNASYRFHPLTLTAFRYMLDFEEAPGDSTSTNGLRAAGSRNAGAIALAYAFSWARQTNRGANPMRVDLDYRMAELGATVRGTSVTGGVEVLEGNGLEGFATPLATLHKFQGWADQFLTTPSNGVEDRYVKLGYVTKRLAFAESISVLASFHWFAEERRSARYGTETDLLLEAKRKRYRATLKYAAYDAAAHATDTEKFWAQLEYVW